MSGTIVDRLRGGANYLRCEGMLAIPGALEEAADRISQLERERTDLIRALTATVERMELDGYEPPHLGGAAVANGRALIERMKKGGA